MWLTGVVQMNSPFIMVFALDKGVDDLIQGFIVSIARVKTCIKMNWSKDFARVRLVGSLVVF